MTVHYKNAQWNNKKVIIGESDLNSDQPSAPVDRFSWSGLHAGEHADPRQQTETEQHGLRLSRRADRCQGRALELVARRTAPEGGGHSFLDYTAQIVDEAHRHLKELTDHDPKICMWGFSQGGAAALVYSMLGSHPLHKSSLGVRFPSGNSRQRLEANAQHLHPGHLWTQR